MKARILDISITQVSSGFRLQIPIATGSLDYHLEYGKIPELDRFLETAINTPSRRFGEPI